MDAMLPLFVAIPLLAAFLIILLGKLIRPLHRWLAPLTLLALLILAFSLFAEAGGSRLAHDMGGWGVLKGIHIGIPLIMDGFSRLMLCIINLIGTIALVYSLSYMRKYSSENYFYALFCLIIAGMNGVVLSGDLFNLFVFMEVSVISSYALVAFGVGKTELEASFKYQVLGGCGFHVDFAGYRHDILGNQNPEYDRCATGTGNPGIRALLFLRTGASS